MNPEAARCLLCKKPFCSEKGCPVHTPVPECMALYREGRLEEAGALLFRNNPLSAVTSLVCDWEKFCFGHCVLRGKGQAVRWYEIEQELSGRYLFSHRLERSSDAMAGRRVAIAGAGPAGIAAAVWLREAGAEVTVFDAQARMGGVLRYGIPDFRLDKRYCDAYEKLLTEAGVVFRGETSLSSAAALREEYDAVLLCTGAETPVRLGIPGEEKALQALAFLREPQRFGLGRKVIVVGGGNVAMDACRTAVRAGCETWVYYRKGFENMPAGRKEVEEARAEGVRFCLFRAPVEIRDGGVVFRNCENVAAADGGRVQTRIIEGTDHFVACDTLLTAVGERPDFSLLPPDILAPDGWPEWSEGLQLKALPRVWLAGDGCTGPRTVVEAVASARIAVQDMTACLGNKVSEV